MRASSPAIMLFAFSGGDQSGAVFDFADPVDWMASAQKKAPGEAGAVKYKGHSDRGEDVKPALHP